MRQVALGQLISWLVAATPERPVRLGRHEVTGVIGVGGMGQVYDAIDLEHGTRVALKTLTRWDPSSLLRFKNEFRSVADLSHPNLVSLYELSRFEDLWHDGLRRRRRLAARCVSGGAAARHLGSARAAWLRWGRDGQAALS